MESESHQCQRNQTNFHSSYFNEKKNLPLKRYAHSTGSLEICDLPTSNHLTGKNSPARLSNDQTPLPRRSTEQHNLTQHHGASSNHFSELPSNRREETNSSTPRLFPFPIFHYSPDENRGESFHRKYDDSRHFRPAKNHSPSTLRPVCINSTPPPPPSRNRPSIFVPLFRKLIERE